MFDWEVQLECMRIRHLPWFLESRNVKYSSYLSGNFKGGRETYCLSLLLFCRHMLFCCICCVSKFQLSWWNWVERLRLRNKVKANVLCGLFLFMRSNLGSSGFFLFNDTPAVAPVTEISQCFHCEASHLEVYYLFAVICILVKSG